MARPIGGWADRVGYRTPMIYGAIGIVFATASASLIVWLRAPWSGAIAMTTLGLAAGLMVTPLTTGVLNSVATEESGLASGINHAITRIGNLLSIALFGVMLVLRSRHHLVVNLTESDLDTEVVAVIEPVIRYATDTLVQADVSELPLNLQAPAIALFTSALDSAFVEVMLAASVCAAAAVWCAVSLSGRTSSGISNEIRCPN